MGSVPPTHPADPCSSCKQGSRLARATDPLTRTLLRKHPLKASATRPQAPTPPTDYDTVT